jgi:polyferredoxin
MRLFSAKAVFWRRFSQLLFFLLFVYCFLAAIYPLVSWIPVDFFLRLDPLIGISASLSARTLIIKSFPALLIILFTIVFGRFFCGWICPLGSLLDGTDRYGSPKNPNERSSARRIKFGILTAVLIGSVFSLQLSGFFDPISLFTRSMTAFLYPLSVFATEGILGFLSKIPFLENPLFNLDSLLRRFLLPLAPRTFQGAVLIGFMLVLIILLGIKQKRFWCRNLCPLGALLGLFSIFRPYRRKVSDFCSSCGLCARKCRMGAIPKDYYETLQTECINCRDCIAVCPTKAVSFGFGRGKSAPVDLSRRLFLSGSIAGLTTLGLVKTGFVHKVQRGKLIRPPGALSEDQFLDRCIRCGECVRICASSGAGLQLSFLGSGWEGIGTPHLKTPMGYCEYNCNLCGQVCPTGAIHSLAMDQKQKMKMGTAHFDKSRCIPYYYGETCMVCEEHCPVPDKAIRFTKQKVVSLEGKSINTLLPYVNETTCIGCGICASCCPLVGEKGIYLTNDQETRWI